MFVYVGVGHTHPYIWSAPSFYSSTATFNNFYSELMTYTVPANSYGISLYDVYQCQGHAH